MARYRCFELLPDGKFFVKATDYIYEDSDKVYRDNLEMYFVESLSSENFEQMAKDACPTIEEAIAKHDAEFEEMYDEFEELKKFKSK